MDLVERAFLYGAEQHRNDTRKGSEIPYVSHLLAVAALVLEAGGDEVQTAAAFLHDVAEDHGGKKALTQIRKRFGDDVAAIVRDLSDSLVDTTKKGQKKEGWEVRKRRYVDHLATVPESSLVVCAADKLHNARSILSDYRDLGDPLWERFNAHDPAQQLWYYRSLADIFTARLRSPLAAELKRTVDDLTRLIEQRHPGTTARADAFATPT